LKPDLRTGLQVGPQPDCDVTLVTFPPLLPDVRVRLRLSVAMRFSDRARFRD
jgi:hypothetical protein